ncbi:c-type cytochrome [Solimonas aquatica]|nr:c-type cytochrome [Solimonas aquatica]
MRIHRGIGLLTATLLLPLVSSAAADAKRGEKLYTGRCGACHSIADNGAGPRHRGLFGCKAGTQAGFNYSDALRKSGIVWDDQTLDRWLADPNKMVPGNSMAVQLASDPTDRADLIAWLRAATTGEGSCQRAGSAGQGQSAAHR